MKKRIVATALMILAGPSFAGIASSHPAEIMNFIQTHNPFIYLTLFFGLGILLAFTPCVLPMVPILSGIITGEARTDSKRGFQLSLSYVLGMSVSYALAGMLAAYFGTTVQTLMQQTWIIVAFSIVFLLMALWLLDVFQLRLPAFQLQKPRQKPKIISAAVMGALSTLVVSPCVTAPLIGILTYISQSGQVLQGGLLLFVLSLGMGVPLLLVGAGYGKFLPKTGVWMKRIKQFFAILMMAMAVWLLGRILSPFWINWLWAAFLLATAFILNHGRHESRGFSRLLQIVAAVSLVSAGAFAYKAIQFNAKATAATASAPFEMVHSLAEVKERLAKAKESHQPVFIEFFANWCSDCQAMDKKVFNQPDVIAAMKGGINLRVDISEKNEAVAAIRKEFVVLGIPTMAFYNAEGQRLDALSAAGQLSKEQMLDLLRQFNETKSS